MTEDLQAQGPEAPLAAPDLTGCENVLPLTDWLSQVETDPEACAPCDLAVITPWYRDLLSQQGYGELAQQVEAVVGSEGQEVDPRRLAETLDNIKGQVENEAVRDTLLVYDCMMQSYKEAEETGGGSSHGED